MGVLAYRSLLILSQQMPLYENLQNALTSALQVPNKSNVYLEVGEAKQLRVSSHRNDSSPSFSSYEIQLAVVVCGEKRINESLTMVKSALLFTRRPLLLHLFTNPELYDNFTWVLSKWKQQARLWFDFNIYDVKYPNSVGQQWRSLFKACVQRLFFPDMLKDVDSLLYVDTDTIFFRPLDHLWAYFKKMNSSHLAALSPDAEDVAIGWYNRFASHPFYGNVGVNSGVMLMNLTKMRSFKWMEKVTAHFVKYKEDLNLTLGDQDIINIIFHFNPDRLYLFPCEWNFRIDHCLYQLICDSAAQNGVSVLRGSRQAFHKGKYPAFKAIYDILSKFDLEADLEEGLLNPVVDALETEPSNCGKPVAAALIKHLNESVHARKAASFSSA